MARIVPNDQEGITQLVRELVAIPSINPGYMRPGDPEARYGEAKVAEYVVDVLRSWKIDAELVRVLPGRPNVVAKLEGRRPGPHRRRLVWQTHMDTVQVDDGMGDPFCARVKGGRIYGRGTVDAKGQLAAMLAALYRLSRTGAAECDLYFAAVVDEEFSFRGVMHLVESGLQADGGVVGEPTGLKIVRACKGCVRWDVHVLGVAAHTSRPHLGRNAIDDAAGLIEFLRENLVPRYQERDHPLVGPPTLTASIIRGGSGPNIVPNRCVVTFDRRVIPGETPREAMAEFAEAVRQYALRTGSRIEIAPPFTQDIPMEVPEDAKIVQVARSVTRRVLGHADVVGAPYSCDAPKMTAAGIPTIVFGAGDIAQAHSREEYVEIDQLSAAVDVLVELARTFR